MEFNKSQIYSSRIQHIALPDFSGSPQEKYDNFFKTILEYFTSLKLDDMHLDSAEINIGGSFFTKKNWWI